MSKINITSLSQLAHINNLLGKVYGTEDFSIFLYSIIKMQKPKNIVELGTGLGVTTFWLAEAVRENGIGHVWTVDDGSHFENKKEMTKIINLLSKHYPSLKKNKGLKYEVFLKQLAKELSLQNSFTFINHRIKFQSAKPMSSKKLKFLRRPIDLVFSDFQHGPFDVLMFLAKFLPHMADYSSVFIDSVPTKLCAFLTLEKAVYALNQGIVPPLMATFLNDTSLRKFKSAISGKSFSLVPLVESKNREQNSTIWLRIYPTDIVPYPARLMRGV